LEHKERKTESPLKEGKNKVSRGTIATEDLPLSGRDFQKGKLG